MKQEKLSFLADSPFYTKRFAFYIGKRCSTSTIKDVAKEFHLDRRAVKELETQYMREKLRRAGNPGPKVIGIDEISIRKGHTYRIERPMRVKSCDLTLPTPQPYALPRGASPARLFEEF